MSELRVGIVGGTRLPGNVQTLLSNLHDLFAGDDPEIDCEVVVRSGAVPTDFAYDVVDPGFPDTDRALETIKVLTRQLIRYVNERDPDVLWQVTKFPVHGFAATVAGRRTGVPVLTRFAGDNFREYELSRGVGDRARTYVLNNVLGRVPARFADATIALGPYGRNEIERRGGRRVYEIPQPVDSERFYPENVDPADLGLSPDGLTLLSVGRVSRRKGMADLPDVADALTDQGVDFTWYVIGDGPMRSRIDEHPRVEALGRVPYDSIPDYYRAVDRLVHLSLLEGLPNVLLEAAACGTPSIARDVGDCALVASATYDEAAQLPALVTREHEPVDLGDRFEPETLRESYREALFETAGTRP